MLKLADGPLLLSQVKSIFRNIENIFESHQKSFLPLFRSIQADPFSLSSCFRELIESGSFQAYLEFCSGKFKADQLCTQHWQFFEEVSLEKRSTFNIEDFLILPLHVLPRYRSTFEELIQACGDSFSCSDDIKLTLKDLEVVRGKLDELIVETNRVVAGELEERVYSPLSTNFQLASNIENDIQAGVQRTLSSVNDTMDISLLRESEKT